MSNGKPADPNRRHAAERRALLRGAAAAVLGAGLAATGGTNAADPDPRKLPARSGDQLAFPSWENDGRLLHADDVVIGAAPLLVYPRDPQSGVIRERSRLNQILVLRFDEAELDPAARATAAAGILAYSALCTHTACGVSEWDGELRHLLCPCHGSAFDPLAGGRRVSGPAPRALPTLPLTINNDEILIAGDFSARVGAIS